jgi:beta-1,4-N-acetylglucosaminyltransferase
MSSLTPSSAPLHVLVVLGEGGHTKQCIRLVDLLGSSRFRYSYVLVSGDHVSAQHVRVPGPMYPIARPANVKSHLLTRLIRLPLCMVQASAIIARARPDVVLSTGPGVAVPVCVMAKLIGSRVIYIESYSRVRTLSLTGRLMRHIADLFFVQWEDLLPHVPEAVFAGRLY